MNLLKFFSAPVDKVVDSVGTAIDKLVTSDEERLALKNELANARLQANLEGEKLELEFDKELTKRHQLDMQSDDKLSKRIRPLSLVFLLGVTAILSITDGNIVWNDYVFTIQEHYIDIYQSLLLLAFGFYFGGRSVEKVAKMISTKK